MRSLGTVIDGVIVSYLLQLLMPRCLPKSMFIVSLLLNNLQVVYLMRSHFLTYDVHKEVKTVLGGVSGVSLFKTFVKTNYCSDVEPKSLITVRL